MIIRLFIAVFINDFLYISIELISLRKGYFIFKYFTTIILSIKMIIQLILLFLVLIKLPVTTNLKTQGNTYLVFNIQIFIVFFSICREKVTYKKQPVCREVKVPVEYVNTTVYHEITRRFLGYEVCQVVLNNQDRNVQKVYRTECYNK